MTDGTDTPPDGEPDTGGDDAEHDGGSDGAVYPDSDDPEHPPEPPTMGDLYDELDDLRGAVDSPAERERVERAIEMAREVDDDAVFGRLIVGFDRADVAEALLGALVFGIPMAVEGGTQEVGAFVSTHPFYLFATLAVAVGIVVGILYVADIQDVRVVKRYFGLVPRRLVGVLGVSFLAAVALMTAWGRVDWARPWLAFAQVSVTFVPMAIGAALGDILPGS